MSFVECLYSAFDSIRQNAVRSTLTALGVIIGVMSVILLISLGEGAQAYVEQEFAGMGSNVLIITPGKQDTMGSTIPMVTDTFNKLTYENSKQIARRAKGIDEVAPFVFGAGFVQFGERRRNTSIVGVSPEFETVRQIFTRIGRYITQADLDKNNRVCVIGTKIKESLFGSKPALYERISINRTKHMVVGILETKGMSLGVNLDDIVMIPLPSAQQMFHGGEDQLFEILVTTPTKEDIPRAMEDIHSILLAAHDYTEDFTITDQDGMLGAFGKIFDALKILLVGISCISLLVGGIGIMNIMLVSVRERTREVGIRKAVGAKRKDIGLQFLIESVFLSVGGGLTGISLGWFGTVLSRFFYPQFPIGLSLWSVSLAFLFSLSVGVFFGVYPALKAASVDPVEALRYE
jgi:putative ABC transport system permease protein